MENSAFSLAFVAKQRYATYDRIVPFLAGVWSICEGMRGPPRESVVRAVKNALLNLLKCTHTGAVFVSATIMFCLQVIAELPISCRARKFILLVYLFIIYCKHSLFEAWIWHISFFLAYGDIALKRISCSGFTDHCFWTLIYICK
jgi:hypothetical protein